LFDNPLRRLVHDPLQILEGLLEPGDTALDLGCGMGYFTVPLAELVGPAGQVIAVDLQVRMLAGVRWRVKRAGLLDRIQLHQNTDDRIGVAGPADFALAFWMVHEVADLAAWLQEVREAVRPGGRMLLAEPVIHVRRGAFEKTIEIAEGVGWQRHSDRKVRFSRAVLLTR